MENKNEGIEILTGIYKKLELPDREVELDLGCGKGSFSVALAEKKPERLILAADVMLGRLRKLHRKRTRMELDNVEILRVEAGMLVGLLLPPRSITRLHILCPDPWPKKKHKGHRLISSEFVGRIAQVLRHGGIFHFATDDDAYFDSASDVVERSGLL